MGNTFLHTGPFPKTHLSLQATLLRGTTILRLQHLTFQITDDLRCLATFVFEFSLSVKAQIRQKNGLSSIQSVTQSTNTVFFASSLSARRHFSSFVLLELTISFSSR